MAKYLYILGAGASSGIRKNDESLTRMFEGEGMPLNTELKDGINSISNRFHTQDYLNTLARNNGLSKSLNEIFEAMRFYGEKAASHASVDTLAKFIYLGNQSNPNSLEYMRYKYLLSTYFLLEEYLIGTDRRYGGWLANLIEDHQIKLAEDVKILTWNYDSQIERTYLNFFPSDARVSNARKHIGVMEPGRSFRNSNESDFRLFKLNGTASYSIKNPDGDFKDISFDYATMMPEFLKGIVDGYKSLHQQPKDASQPILEPNVKFHLNFAWDANPNLANRDGKKSFHPEILNQLIPSLEKVKELIVIGYSFPYFNRKVDRLILQHLPNLEMVTIQNPDAESVSLRFKAMRPISASQLKLEKDVSFFLLPDSF